MKYERLPQFFKMEDDGLPYWTGDTLWQKNNQKIDTVTAQLNLNMSWSLT
jgi:hypothetical protein